MRTNMWIALVLSVAFAVALGAAQKDIQKDPRAEAQLQAAIIKETVEGDLRGAIELYKMIAALPGASRTTVATALLRMGQCHEKLGEADTQEARKAYEQVVRDYADQAAVAAEARTMLAALTGAGSASVTSTLTVRRVWARADVTGKVLADGRFLSFTDWAAGNVAIRDLATGQSRLLTDAGDLGKSGGFAEPSMPSPDGKNVAYAWSTGNSRNLCVVGTDGSKPRVLGAARNDVIHYLPIAWSPDSRHLLAEFVKTDGTRDMMLVDVVDGLAKLLKAIGKNPSPGGEFSPDGRYIAWEAKDGLSLFDLRTGMESPLLADRSNPSVLGWAPDGAHILFSSERSGSADAWLIAVAGGKAPGEPVLVRRNWGNIPMGFTRSGAFYFAVINNVWDTSIVELDPASGNMVSSPQPAFRRRNTRSFEWSPDGRSLAAIDAREPRRAVIVRSMDTGEERELQVGARTIMNGGLRWTPDGKAVVVPASEPGKGEGLIRIDVQTGTVTSLMPFPALGGWPRFELSGDGNKILYVRPPDPSAADASRLVSHDLRSGQETEIVRKPGLIWGTISPDAQRVVINTNYDKSWSLLVMPASGGELRELVKIDREKETPYLGSPSWTPDGRGILFQKRSVQEKTPMQWQLWRVAVEGGGPQRVGGPIAAKSRFQGARLHTDGRRVAFGDISVDLEVWVMENFLPAAKVAK